MTAKYLHLDLEASIYTELFEYTPNILVEYIIFSSEK